MIGLSFLVATNTYCTKLMKQEEKERQEKKLLNERSNNRTEYGRRSMRNAYCTSVLYTQTKEEILESLFLGSLSSKAQASI
jgi:hypothetical protein